MLSLRQTALLRGDVDENGRPISIEEREHLLAPFLPDESDTPKSHMKSRKNAKAKQDPWKTPLRSLIRTALYVLVFNLMQLVFSIFYKVRQTYRNVISRSLDVMYHHHRSPELIQKDVRDFKRLPQHLSIILDLDGRRDDAALETLINNMCECAAWTACMGIPVLSIYERTGECLASRKRCVCACP